MSNISISLLFLLLLSSLAVVTVRHENRLAFIKVQELEQKRDQLQTQWGRLILEKATWAMENNIAEEASARLHMSPPPADQIVTVQLNQAGSGEVQ